VSYQTAKDRAIEDMIEFSHRLVAANLLEFKGGNLSVRLGNDDMLITQRSSAKGILSPDDFVCTSLTTQDEGAFRASSAMEIHRAIYQRTDARAIIHAHPPTVVSLSFFMDHIVPPDENGLLYLRPRMSVVAAPTLFGWNLVAEEMADCLTDEKVVVEKWHGTFAKGKDLVEAFHRTRAAEFTAGHLVRLAEMRRYFGEPALPPEQIAEFIGGIDTRGLSRVS
jgi:L-fuculose-phosphate aldolase